MSEAALEKQKIALFSMGVSLALALAKLVVAVVTGSLGVLSEALHSIVDFGATVITWLAVRWSDEPADDEHHFGHAKIESVASLFECVLLFGIALYVAFEAVHRLVIGETPHVVGWWAVALVLAVIAIDWNRSRALSKVALEHESEALAADAAHFQSDMLGSAAVLSGLVGLWLGFGWADSVAALLVSLLIAWIGYGLGRKALETLLDRAPAGLTEKVRRLVDADPGVLRVSDLRLRQAGAVTYINIVADVPRSQSLIEVGALKERLIGRIKSIRPNADVSLVTNPVELGSENVFDKVAMIAGARKLSVHHLTVQNLGGRMAVSFDVEFDAETPLSTAHETATELENDIRQSLGAGVEVESHIEPKPVHEFDGAAAEAKDVVAVKRALKLAAKPERGLKDVHNLRVRQTEGGLFVHYHCRFEPTMTVSDVHAIIDRVEIRLVAKRPDIKRVIAHAEPLGGRRHEF